MGRPSILALACCLAAGLLLPCAHARAQTDADPQASSEPSVEPSIIPSAQPSGKPSVQPSVQATPPSSLLEQGKQAYGEGRFADAVEILLQALQQREDPELYTYLGLAYYSLGTYSLAIDAFAAARDLYDHPPPNLLFSLALSYYYAHNLDQAQEYLKQVLNHPQTTPELRRQAEEQQLLTLRDQSADYQQGLAAYQAGNYAEAYTAFSQVLAIVPDSAEIHYYLGLSAYQLLNFDQARRSLQQVITLAPESEYADSARQTLDVISKLEQNLPPKPFFGAISLGLLGDSNV
ncbi:MAG TPA: tetratricopeptide repeat protein, partial [Candidatus Obscuribacterales bacterium]